MIIINAGTFDQNSFFLFFFHFVHFENNIYIFFNPLHAMQVFAFNINISSWFRVYLNCRATTVYKKRKRIKISLLKLFLYLFRRFIFMDSIVSRLASHSFLLADEKMLTHRNVKVLFDETFQFVGLKDNFPRNFFFFYFETTRVIIFHELDKG